MASLVLQNRWKLFTNQEEEEEVRSTTVEEYQEVKSTYAEGLEVGNWLVDESRRSRRRRRRRCLFHELPQDVISLIFSKLGPIELLCTVQYVCSSWRSLCKETHLFRSLVVRYQHTTMNVDYFEELVRKAVDRSCGELVEFSSTISCSFESLYYVVSKSKSLRCLRLVSCDLVSNQDFISIVTYAPCLEELELRRCSFSGEVIEEIGRLCSRLQYFRLDCEEFEESASESDEEAFAIAKNMNGLRRLSLFGNRLTNSGLEAILDGCSRLEDLDIRHCFNINLTEDLQMKCLERLQVLRLFDDSSYDDGNADEWRYNGNEYEYQEDYEYHDEYEYQEDNGCCDDYDDHEDEVLMFLPPKAATCYL